MAVGNLFLRHLRAQDLELLKPELRKVDLAINKVITEEGAEIQTALLPINAIISVITVMRDGRTVESRTLGRESGFGLLHALGSPYAFERVVVQIGGEAWAVPVQALARLAIASPDALKTIGQFAQSSLVQSTVALACNALHDVESRLCRWLLMTQDRLESDLLPLTQEHLSTMLAVQRTTVNAAARRLQDRGAVRYSRGRIRILDRGMLLRFSCECYEQIEESARRLIGAEQFPVSSNASAAS